MCCRPPIGDWAAKRRGDLAMAEQALAQITAAFETCRDAPAFFAAREAAHGPARSPRLTAGGSGY
jgi:hypothetical protein